MQRFWLSYTRGYTFRVSYEFLAETKVNEALQLLTPSIMIEVEVWLSSLDSSLSRLSRLSESRSSSMIHTTGRQVDRYRKQLGQKLERKHNN